MATHDSSVKISRERLLDEMRLGFPALADQCRDYKMTWNQRIQEFVFLNLLPAMRLFHRPVDFTENIDRFTGQTLKTRGTTFQESAGACYLSKEEIKQFEQDGLLGPFDLLTQDQADEIVRTATLMHEQDWDNSILIGSEIADSMKRHKLWSIQYSGMWQALRHEFLWNLLCAPQISQRVASLLGDDVICWMSHFFEKPPQATGTFWHQASTFRGTSAAPKLVPVKGIDSGAVQLTVWIALTDSTVRNGCLRMLPGSFVDSRFEELAFRMIDNKVGALAQLPRKKLREAFWAFRCTTGPFPKAQLLFDLATEQLPDLFNGMIVRDIDMKPGQFVIFSSLNMHASYPNSTKAETRLSFVGRYTSNDVRVTPVGEREVFTTPDGDFLFQKERIGCMQVHGEDKFGHNKICQPPIAKPSQSVR